MKWAGRSSPANFEHTRRASFFRTDIHRSSTRFTKKKDGEGMIFLFCEPPCSQPCSHGMSNKIIRPSPHAPRRKKFDVISIVEGARFPRRRWMGRRHRDDDMGGGGGGGGGEAQPSSADANDANDYTVRPGGRRLTIFPSTSSSSFVQKRRRR